MSFGKLGALGRGFGHLGALGRVGTSGGVTPALMPGSATLNLGGNDLNASTFINVLKAASYNWNTKTDATCLDDDGYVVSTPSSTIFLAFSSSATFTGAGVTYKLAWPATRSTWTWQFIGTNTAVSNSNATVTGGTASNMTVTPTTPGQAGYVTFTTTSSGFTINIGLAGQTYAAGSGEIALYRLSDETDYLAGEYYTPEFKSLVSTLRPNALRFMGWVQSGSSNLNFETTYAYRNKLTNLTWNGNRPVPAAWGGTVSGTDTYTIAAASGSPANWTDGEVIQGIVTNANTVTTPTLSITGHTGAKTIVTTGGGALSAGSISAGTFATFVYDGLLDKVLFRNNLNSVSVPIEAQAQLCNKVRSNLWATIPPMASDNYVTQWATGALNTLSSDLYFYPEYSNEIWNFSFPQTSWAGARGTALGFTSSSNRHHHGWYGLRVRQIMGTLIPAVWSGRMSKLRRTLMYQAAGDSPSLTYRMKGTDLAPSGSGGAGNATWNSWTGSANYTANPNRPIDFIETIGYAPYAGGANLCFGPDINFNGIPSSLNTAFYQALVTAWEGGDSATSLAMIDGDIRGGLTAVQTVTWDGVNSRFQTPLAHGFTAGSTNIAFTVSGGTNFSGLTTNGMYRVLTTPTANTFTFQAFAASANGSSGGAVNPGSAGTGTTSVGWMGGALNSGSSSVNIVTMQYLDSAWYGFGEYLAAQFDSDRPGGMSALRVEQYEGSLELVGPTSAQLTTLGVTGTTPYASINAAIEAWKNSSYAQAAIVDYYKQFMGQIASVPTYGIQLHSYAPAHLVLQQAVSSPAGVWGLTNGLLPNNANYRLYDGFAQFSGGTTTSTYRILWGSDQILWGSDAITWS